jgi:hypothetical protein
MNYPLQILALRCAAFLGMCSISFGASVILIDDFSDGPFSLTTETSMGVSDAQQGNMLGGSRSVRISTSRRITTVSAMVDATSPLLVFNTGDGSMGLLDQGNIWLQWSTGGALNLQEHSAFVFKIHYLQGTGTIHVGLNEQGYGSNSSRVPLTSSGVIEVPMSSIDLPNGTLADIRRVQIVIAGTSPDFAFSVGEISIIPEPSAFFLVSWGAVLLGMRHRRTPSLMRVSDI